LMTSAPRSLNIRAQCGPDNTRVKSNTRSPSSGRGALRESECELFIPYDRSQCFVATHDRPRKVLHLVCHDQPTMFCRDGMPLTIGENGVEIPKR